MGRGPLAVSQALGLPLPQQRRDDRLEGGIRLVGLEFPGAARIDTRTAIATVRASRSRGLGAVLLWSAEAGPPENYSVFVHLRDPSGATVAQHDGWPACGTAPTAGWSPGDVIIDAHALDLRHVAVGEYRLVAGFYRPETGERLGIAAAMESSGHAASTAAGTESAGSPEGVNHHGELNAATEHGALLIARVEVVDR